MEWGTTCYWLTQKYQDEPDSKYHKAAAYESKLNIIDI